MARTDYLALIFWVLIFATGSALFGLYQCGDWDRFLRWLTFFGLILDATGALALVAAEFSALQSFLWPGLVAAKSTIKEKKDSNLSSHTAFLEREDDGFNELATITRNYRSLSNREQEDQTTEIREFSFWPRGDIYAKGYNVNQVTLGSPEEVDLWIQERMKNSTRDKIYPLAAGVLFIGFALQILSYWWLKL